MKAPVAKEMSNQAFTSESKKGTAPSAKARRSASRVPKPSAQPHLSETDLYAPVRDLLLAQGYTVRAEVNGCDLVAVRDEHMVIVELKTAFNTALLIQAADRQRIADEVYIAIPRPDKSLRSARWEGILHLLRRLELGLIFVRLPQTRNRSVAQAEIALLPEPYIGKRQTRVRKKILRETVHRSADYNVGGSTRTPLITAYRERAVHIACCLAHFGDMSPRALRLLGTGDQTTGILRRDVYGWFARVSRGLYRLTAAGQQALQDYKQVAAPYMEELAQIQSDSAGKGDPR